MIINSRPSPHFNARAKSITAIVLHSDQSPSTSATINHILNPYPNDPKKRVSYHYLVGRLGHVYQFVDESDRAWHAGPSEFSGEANCNDYSLGLAFSNLNNGELYTDVAMLTMVDLCREIMNRYPVITKDRITTHALTARPLGRKSDPCPPFDLAAFLEMV